jgi:hypothetical protein
MNASVGQGGVRRAAGVPAFLAVREAKVQGRSFFSTPLLHHHTHATTHLLPILIHAAESTGYPRLLHISAQRTACELIPKPQSWPTRDLRTSRRVSRVNAHRCDLVSYCACAAIRESDWEPPRRASNSCTDEIARPAQIESNYDETTDSFDAMELKPELLRGVYAYGFERPSAIQQRAIMPVIKGT